jgi:hypothetical protein
MALIPAVSVNMGAGQISEIRTKGEYVGYIENQNVSFTLKSSWSWHKCSVAVFIQDETSTNKKYQNCPSDQNWNFNSAEVIQAAWHPLDGSTRSTGDERFVLFEKVGRAHCTYEPGAACAFDRLMDNSSIWDDKVVPIWWPYPNGQYASDMSVERAGSNGYGINPIPAFLFDGVICRAEGAKTDSPSIDNRLISRINTRKAIASPYNITLRGNANNNKAWINVTVKVLEDQPISRSKLHIVVIEDVNVNYNGDPDRPMRCVAREIVYKKAFANDPPKLKLTCDHSDQTLEGGVDITWTASDTEDDDDKMSIVMEYKDPITGNWMFIDSSLNTGSYTWDTTNVDDGEGFMLRAWTEDSREFKTYATMPGEFSIDNPTPPNVILTAPGDGGIYSQEIDITWDAWDDEDGTNLDVDITCMDTETLSEFVVVQDTENDGSHLWDVTGLEDGYYIMTITVTDSYGYSVFDQNGNSFSIDNLEYPEITITKPAKGDTICDMYEITWDSSDPEDDRSDLMVVIDISKDQSTWTELGKLNQDNGKYSFDTSRYEDGDYYLQITVTDTDSLSATAVSDRFNIYNPDAPVLKTDSFDEPWVLSGDWELEWEATDADGDVLKIDIDRSEDNAEWVSVAAEEENDGEYVLDTMALADGEYNFKITATDNSVYQLSTSVVSEEAIKVYNPDAPVVNILDIKEGETIHGLFTLKWEGTDADVGEVLTFDVHYSNDGKEWIQIASGLSKDTYEMDTNSNDNGNAYFKVVATDDSSYALTGEAVSPKLVVENSYAPVVELTSPSGLKTLSGDVKITWTASDKNGDVLTVNIKVDQKSIINDHPNEGTYTWDCTDVANGDYEMRITVSDGKNTASDFVKVKICNQVVAPEPEPEEPEVTKPKEEEGMGAGVIVAVVVLSLIMVLAVCGLVLFLVVFKKKKKTELPPPKQQTTPSMPPMQTPARPTPQQTPTTPQTPAIQQNIPEAQTAVPIMPPQTQQREGDWGYKSYNGTNGTVQNTAADNQQYMETRQNYNNYL